MVFVMGDSPVTQALPGVWLGKKRKIPCCIYDIVINFNKYIIDWQHHKRQEIIYHTQYNGCRSIDNFEGRKSD